MGSPDNGSNGSRHNTITGMALRSTPPTARSKQEAVSFERDTDEDNGVGEAVYEMKKGRLTMKGHRLQSEVRFAGEQIAAAVKQTLDEPTKADEEDERIETPIPESDEEKVNRILALFPAEPVLPPAPEPTPEEQRAALDAMEIPDLCDEDVLQPTRLPTEELPFESISSLIHRSKMALAAAISLGTVLGVAGGKYIVAPTLSRLLYGDTEATFVSKQQKPENISSVPVSPVLSASASVPDVPSSASVEVPVEVAPNYPTGKRPAIFGSGSASPSVLVPAIPSATPAVSSSIENKPDIVNPWEGEDLPKVDTSKSDQADPWNKQPKISAPSSSQ